MRRRAFFAWALSIASWTPTFTVPVCNATFRACARSILRLHFLDLVGRGEPVDEVDGARPEGDRLADDDVLGDALQLVDLARDRRAEQVRRGDLEGGAREHARLLAGDPVPTNGPDVP